MIINFQQSQHKIQITKNIIYRQIKIIREIQIIKDHKIQTNKDHKTVSKRQRMQNVAFPFNQKEHIFDFKVKVNFENGNISLTAPQIIAPPVHFNNQSNGSQNFNQYQNPYSHSQNQRPNQINPIALNNNITNIQEHFSPANNQAVNSARSFPKVDRIESVNSSYTSLKQENNQSFSNNSIQMIQCVLCQKSFSPTQLDTHLQLHKNRVNKNYTAQKDHTSNYAKTQNSLNGQNDSILSDPKSRSSFQNQSYQSQKSLNQSLQNNLIKNSSSFVSLNQNVTNSKEQKTQQIRNQNPKFINSSQINQPTPQNQSYHLLGRIQNPLLAIKGQQSSLSQSYSSHPNQSLNYSYSQGQQSTTRFNNPINSNDQSPQFHNPHSSNSSFGHQPGNNVIGPSFYQNSSIQSANQPKGVFFKGINRLAYNQVNGSINSSGNLITNPLPVQKQSFYSNQSSQMSNHQNPPIEAPMILNGSQKYYQQPSNSFSNSRNSVQSNHSSISNGSMHANFMTVSNPNPVFQNFQTIQSRYVNQPISNSRQLYSSCQQINQIQQQNSRNFMRNEEIPFSQSEISSISYQSRGQLSHYSDWTDLNSQSQQRFEGYNSADNSIIKNMQQQNKQQKNNIYLSRRSNNERQKGQSNFFKKKKDFMINSAASYYDRKFKDEESSSDEENVYKTARLSYMERLKQKRISDNLRSIQMSQAKSTNKLKQSHRSNNLSKYSDDSNMSKTKLPVNYLAREEFISTSSTSKSTHKTNVPN